MLTDDLMQRLAVAAALDQLHEQAFAGSEGAVRGEQARRCGEVHLEAVDQPAGAAQQFIADQERLRQQTAAVGRIVEGALQQRVGGIVPGHAREGRQIARQAVDVLGVDGVALKRHSTRSHLARTERLRPLADGRRLQQTQIEGELVEGLAQAGKGSQDAIVLLARVSLRGDRDWLQVDCLHHLALQLLRRPIGLRQQLRIRSKGPHRALEPLAAYLRAQTSEVLPIGPQILGVLGQPVADRRRLGWLQVREGHRRRVGPLLYALGERQEHAPQTLQDQVEGLARAQGIGVVLDIHRGSAKMDDAAA